MMHGAFVPLICLALLLGACAKVSKSPTSVPVPTVKPQPQKSVKLQITPWTFSTLEGWIDDDQGRALLAFQKSCDKILSLPADYKLSVNGAVPSGQVKNWQGACLASQELNSNDKGLARRFFETWFAPYEVKDLNVNDQGLFTGYYEPQLNGSTVRGGAYQIPLLSRPKDLVSVNLGNFDGDLGGNTIWGRVVKDRLKPYPNRADIENGALGDLAKPILWVASIVDAFFLQIQGSGQVKLPNGEIVHVGFAGKNGQPYRSIGRLLIKQGEIPADRLTMDAIRKWIDVRPQAGPKLLQHNPTYVFFKILNGDGPLGAQGVALTAGRSLAIDRRFMPLGVPIWLQTRDPLNKDKPFNRLMVAQDTGGAIKGVVRGDIFFGSGKRATKRAGNMKHPGRYFILLPHSVMPDLAQG